LTLVLLAVVERRGDLVSRQKVVPELPVNIVVGCDKGLAKEVEIFSGWLSNDALHGDARLEGRMIRLLGSTAKADGGIAEGGESDKGGGDDNELHGFNVVFLRWCWIRL
jgi:hypothetical protein